MMRRLILILLIVVLGAVGLDAQSTAITAGTALPAHCSVTSTKTNIFYKTSATVGFYVCTATDTWTLITTAPVSVTNGGSGAAPGADDQVFVSSSTSAGAWKTLTDCAAANSAITYTASSNTWGCNTITGGGGGIGTVTTSGSPSSGQYAQFSGTTSITGVAAPARCQFRLTTETGVPVSSSDRSAQGTIYLTPSSPTGMATGTGVCTFYNGTTLVDLAFTQISLVLSSLTSGKNYDVFADYNSGTPQLVLSAAWTNDTTRSDALATQAGIVVKSGTPAYHWVGTIRTTGTTTTEDSQTKRFVWNAYNQVPRLLYHTDATASWNYTLNTWQQANASSANQVEYVTGDASTRIIARVLAASINGNATSRGAGVGLDSITDPSGVIGVASVATSLRTAHLAMYEGQPGLGYHYVAALEASAASGTTTWAGTLALGGTTEAMNGIFVTLVG